MSQIDSTLLASDRLEALKRRLDDPQVADALGQLLDHVDLIALLVSGLDGLLRRSETVGDSLTTSLEDLRQGADGVKIDLPALAGSLATLSRVLVGSAPTLERLIESDLVAPATVDTVALAGRALATGYARAQQHKTTVTGLRAVLRLLKEPDVARGLGFLSEVAKGLGQELNRADSTVSTRTGS